MEKTILNKKQHLKQNHTTSSVKIYDIVITGLMAALVFVGTYFLKFLRHLDIRILGTA